MVRPSYVLGGRAMEVVYDDADLRAYLTEAVQASDERPVLVDRFLRDAAEVDVDVVSDGKSVIVGGVMEHIEEAGIHSGDSACALPPYSLSPEVIAEIEKQSIALARELGVVGLMNVQFAIQGEDIYVLEVNPRASRTVPFVGKATGVPFAKKAALAMAGISLAEQGLTATPRPAPRLGEGGGHALRPLPRRRPGPRPGDEVHRRGHGDRRRLLRRLLEVPDRRRERAAAPAARGVAARLRLGEGRRQAASPPTWPGGSSPSGSRCSPPPAPPRSWPARASRPRRSARSARGAPTSSTASSTARSTSSSTPPRASGPSPTATPSGARRSCTGFPYFTTLTGARAALGAMERARDAGYGVRSLQEYHAHGR